MLWGYSSAGRAPALHAGGQRFDPVMLHHVNEIIGISLKVAHPFFVYKGAYKEPV